jgi:hypothetical protein
MVVVEPFVAASRSACVVLSSIYGRMVTLICFSPSPFVFTIKWLILYIGKGILFLTQNTKKVKIA